MSKTTLGMIRELSDENLKQALLNVGCDVECGTCMSGFFTGQVFQEHDPYCDHMASVFKPQISDGTDEIIEAANHRGHKVDDDGVRVLESEYLTFCEPVDLVTE